VTGHLGFVFDIEFNTNSSGFYSLSYDRTIRYFDFNKSEIIKYLQIPLKTFALSPDNTFIIGGSDKGHLVYLDLQKLEEVVLYEQPGIAIHSVDISPDGKFVAFGGNDGIGYIRRIEENEEYNTLRGHTSRINTVKFSDDGKMLATGSFDGSIQLYVMNELDDLPILMKDHDTYVWDVNFSTDGEFLVAATNSGILKMWPTNAEYYAEQICKNLARNMSDQEWDRYVPNGIDYTITCSAYKTGEGGE